MRRILGVAGAALAIAGLTFVIRGGTGTAREPLVLEKQATVELVQDESIFKLRTGGRIQLQPGVTVERQGNTLMLRSQGSENAVRCGCQSGCSGECTISGSSSDLKCRGGCYKPDGNACTSCYFSSIGKGSKVLSPE